MKLLEYTAVGLLVFSRCPIAKGQVQFGLPGKALTVCEILSSPLSYEGRIVTIVGPIQGTDEGTWFVGEDCPGVWVAEGHKWPSVIALMTPNSIPPPLRIHTVDFMFDLESDRRVERKYRSLASGVPPRCVLFTYTGMLETQKDWTKAKAVYPDGTWRFIGFGHLGEAPARLLLKSADDVTVRPNCGAPPAKADR